MKYSYYLASLCLLFRAYCYSQHYQIDDKYRGDPFFKKINMNKLEKMLGWSYILKGEKYFLNHIPKETTNHDHHLHVQYYDMKKVKEIKE